MNHMSRNIYGSLLRSSISSISIWMIYASPTFFLFQPFLSYSLSVTQIWGCYPNLGRSTMVNVTTSGPLLDFNSKDHTASVVIVTVFFCLLMIMVMIAKVFIRRSIGISLHDFDLILFLAALLMLGQTLCIVCASNPGLGKHSTDVAAHVEKVRKLQYAASLLAIATVTCTKISMSLLIKRINDYGRVRLANRAILGITLLSFISGVVATAFQCPLPQPWTATNPSTCPGIVPIYLYSGIMSVITDVELCVLAVAMVWDIKMDLKKRYIVIALFSPRILCPATTIPALFYKDYLFQGNDFTWLAVVPTTWLQISYNLSVITACIPSMKNIFDSFSGNFSAAIDVPYNLPIIPSKSGSRATARGLSKGTGGSSSTMDSSGLKLTPAHPSRTSCYKTDVFSSGTRTRTRDDDGQNESVRNLTDGVVVVTEEVDIQFENRAPSPDGSHVSWDDNHRRRTGSC
ncbi:hypothetical protein VM1G_05712 [Cytospora mali]|uniref:Rhodopsin domain-containing protein n=1 Tax=Cytospora mali TaxID=578113 RepID=A0A194W3G4_CYTMA|nr:hypothetical protein VM1G_05712 [Valsa mali]